MTLNWIKENLNLVLLIPTILGGIWQLLELATIDTSFIRFFSISQVISDGLLILFISLIIFLSMKFSFFVSLNIERTPKPLYIIRLIIIPIICLFFISFFIYLYFNSQNVPLPLFYITLSSSVVLIGYFIEIIGTKRVKRFLFGSLFVEHIFPFTLLIFILFSIYIFPSPFDIFHRKFLFPKNLKNIDNIEHNLDLKFKDYQVLYLNDKYIFIELTIDENNKVIEILNFEKLFEKKESN